MTDHPLPVVAVTGLAAEARVVGGPGIATVAGGGDPARLALLLRAALDRGARAVISFGIAGGLAPALRPGTVLLARAVFDGRRRVAADRAWLEHLARALPHAVLADLAGVDRVVAGIAAKRALHRDTGAAAVDMESHVAGRLAAQHRVPFAALRVVADPADRGLPHAATVGMRPDGSTDVRAVLRSLLDRPRDVPALIRTALDARTAFAGLHRSRASLGEFLGPVGTTEADAGRAPIGESTNDLGVPVIGLRAKH